MPGSTIDIHDIDEGVDRKQLSLVRQRFIDLNKQRYARTCAALSDRQQQFLVLLPLLFHVNHPMLPGYYSHQTVCGIHDYVPDKDELRIAKNFAKSFKFQRDLIIKDTAIEAIFVMGSIGTVAHSDSSDLDIWVCHSPTLTEAELAELQIKCQRISEWAEQSTHIETHFFLMESTCFRTGKVAQLSSEASGSAQHYLLLDEFYRTALWIAGKIPLWWFVPVSQEEDYDNYTSTLLNKRFIRARDVIDFGGLSQIPKNEFIGAGIWQLYKGIEAPYKSVLKLLLLEAYASDSNNEPLSIGLKRNLYSDAPDTDQLDPYVMIYQRLEEYLKTLNQLQRLELVRRCFYFKVNKPLTRASRNPQKSWQRLLLEKLVAQWNWQERDIKALDHRAQWKASHVITERSLLVNELSNSYRLLTDLHKDIMSLAAITSEELMILGRKLHAAFERKAGKIEWINPGISKDLHEPALCAVHTEEDNQSWWQIYCESYSDFNAHGKRTESIKRTRHLMELLLWCYCNGLLRMDTKLDIVSKSIHLTPIQTQHLLHTFHHWLPLPLAPVAHEEFKQSAQPTRLLLLFNIGIEPQTELHKKGMQMLSSKQDALGYSGFRENLVLSVDVIHSNNWQEIVCRHYPTDALINGLLHYLRMLPPGRGFALPELTIRCFSTHQGTLITQRLEELWRDIIACYYSGTRPGNSRYILEMGDEYLLIQFLQQQPHITRYQHYEQLLAKLGNAQMEYSPIGVDRHGLKDKPLKIFSSTVNLPGIYIFYQILPRRSPNKTLAEISIIDEKGSLFTTEMAFHNQQTLLRPLLFFIQKVMGRQSFGNQLSAQHMALQSVQCFELVGNLKQQQGYTEARLIGSNLNTLPFIDIQVIADITTDNEITYTVYCDQQEFSVQKYGGEMYARVAQFILTHRKERNTYPCYITDLDLSNCQDFIAAHTGLQLIHYLQIKAELEQKINLALTKIH